MVFAVEQRTFCVSFDRVFVLSVHFVYAYKLLERVSFFSDNNYRSMVE